MNPAVLLLAVAPVVVPPAPVVTVPAAQLAAMNPLPYPVDGLYWAANDTIYVRADLTPAHRAAVIRHEAIHAYQAREHGPWFVDVIGRDQAEAQADCGQVELARREGVTPWPAPRCTPEAHGQVVALIDRHHGRTVPVPQATTPPRRLDRPRAAAPLAAWTSMRTTVTRQVA